MKPVSIFFFLCMKKIENHAGVAVIPKLLNGVIKMGNPDLGVKIVVSIFPGQILLSNKPIHFPGLRNG